MTFSKGPDNNTKLFFKAFLFGYGYDHHALLILDDFSLAPMDNQARHALMDIFEDRYEKNSAIIASQIPVEKWHETIGDTSIADAVLDRLVYSSNRIELEGDSIRRKKKLDV